VVQPLFSYAGEQTGKTEVDEMECSVAGPDPISSCNRENYIITCYKKIKE
jgi:hypothetical protein